MSEAIQGDTVAFALENGGGGARLAVTGTTSSVAIPDTQAKDNLRVCVTNLGLVAAFVRFGQSGVVATSSCQAVLPGTQTVWNVPGTRPSQLYMAAITEGSGTTTLQVTPASRGI
jgi:hypothetical protein